MAQPSNTFSTYDAAGNREDLADVIYTISPTEVPFLSMVEHIKASSTKHEWQRDALASASSTNFVIEGDDATTDAATATTRLYNYTAISDKVARTTGTERAMNPAGRGDEHLYQIEKRAKELRRDVEKICLENNAYVAGNDTLARESAGLQAWIKTNTNIASDATASAGNGSDAHTDGTARALLESMVEDVLAQAWDEGGNPTIGILNSFQKRKFAAFSGNTTRTQEVGKGNKLVNSVDVYVDPLGSEVQLYPDHFAPTDVIYFLDLDYVKYATLRDFETVELAKTGDSDRTQIIVEHTVHMGNEAAHAAVYDLTAS